MYNWQHGSTMSYPETYKDPKTGKTYNYSWNEFFKDIKSGIGKVGNWLLSENEFAKAIQNSKLWKGLTGETSAQATIEANERNIENQNYWNMIAMEREDTAHQREVADLQAAGLNPWLSMGNGAQSTAYSTAQANPVDGSKILSATTGMALLAIIKLLAKKV